MTMKHLAPYIQSVEVRHGKGLWAVSVLPEPKAIASLIQYLGKFKKQLETQGANT